MRLNRAIVILAAAVLIGWGMGATDDKIKIGVIDLEQAWSSTDEGKEVRDQLQRKLRAAEAKMQPMIESFQQLQKEMQEMQHVLSKEALQKRQFDLVELKGQLENESAGLEQQLKLEEARLTSPLREKFVAVVDEIGRKEGFSLILLRGAPGIMYSREALDITDLVVEAFNKKG
jgi:outer membrane protein